MLSIYSVSCLKWQHLTVGIAPGCLGKSIAGFIEGRITIIKPNNHNYRAWLPWFDHFYTVFMNSVTDYIIQFLGNRAQLKHATIYNQHICRRCSTCLNLFPISHLFCAKADARFPDAIAVTYDPVSRWLCCVYNDHSLYVWDVKDVSRVGKVHSALFHAACVGDLEVGGLINTTTVPEITRTQENTEGKEK